MLRRIAGLASAILLMRLNLVPVDTRCAQHDAAPPAAGVQAHDHTAMSDNAHPSPSQPTESCDRPVVPECCRALAPCSVALDIGTAARDDTLTGRDPERLALGRDLPNSFRAAPDPPPPKA